MNTEMLIIGIVCIYLIIGLFWIYKKFDADEMPLGIFECIFLFVITPFWIFLFIAEKRRLGERK